MRGFIPLAVAIVASTLSLAPAAAQGPSTQPVRLGVGQQVTIAPGFAVGDVSGAHSTVADYRISRDRRQVTLLGLKVGAASVSLWDQQNRHRLDISIAVVQELEDATVRQLTTLLATYPGVSLLNLEGRPLISGHVDAPEELQVLQRLAEAAGIQCGVVVRAKPQPEERQEAKVAVSVEYELRLLEADLGFTTQAYDSGVEPSGRELYKAHVVATIDATAQTFIGGRPMTLGKKPSQAGGPETGLRISFTPRGGSRGEMETEVLVETNLPVNTTVYSPTEWRRFRQSFPTKSALPLAVAGNDLLAAPEPPPRKSRIKTTTRWIATIASLPGVHDVKGATQVPVFSNLLGSAAYREGRTQLVLVIVPRVSAPATE